MTGIAALWLPILLSAVVVFVVSSVIHMFAGYHAGDFRKLPQQAAMLDRLRADGVAPGDYMLPRPQSMQEMRTKEFVDLVNRGPVVVMSVGPGGMGMGRNLSLWFAYLLVMGVCCAYIASRELSSGASYLAVFRITGFAAFMGYAMALPQASIWYHRNWRMTLVTMCDGLLFAALTGGVFGWLWPR
jgi:hypothetical protein